MRTLQEISTFFHTDFGSKPLARRVGPPDTCASFFPQRFRYCHFFGAAASPCDMWPLHPSQLCVTVRAVARPFRPVTKKTKPPARRLGPPRHRVCFATDFAVLRFAVFCVTCGHCTPSQLCVCSSRSCKLISACDFIATRALPDSRAAASAGSIQRSGLGAGAAARVVHISRNDNLRSLPSRKT
jgi:hypothetical protein